MGTTEDLKEAFAGESQANRKYTAFARKAEDEGYSQVAKLFRAAAEAETVHALEHLRVLGMIGSTEENLRAAVDGETYEHENMYPGFIEEAKSENNQSATTSFWRANEVEKIHDNLYRKALESLGRNQEVDYYVCGVCGNTVENEAPDACPVCGAEKEKFTLIR